MHHGGMRHPSLQAILTTTGPAYARSEKEMVELLFELRLERLDEWKIKQDTVSACRRQIRTLPEGRKMRKPHEPSRKFSPTTRCTRKGGLPSRCGHHPLACSRGLNFTTGWQWKCSHSRLRSPSRSPRAPPSRCCACCPARASSWCTASPCHSAA